MNTYLNEYYARTNVHSRVEQVRSQQHLAEYLRTSRRNRRLSWPTGRR
jgi:hypothetical protein